MATLEFNSPKLPSSFWSKVEPDPETGCWDWVACKLPAGYGQFIAPKALGQKQWLAHRYTLLTALGIESSPLEVDHTCRNRSCCNPEHLRLVTAKQNRENVAGAWARSKTGVRGVSPSSNPRRNYQAQVTHNKRHYHLGHFDTIAEAEAVVKAKRLELFTHNDVDREPTHS